jgi:glucose-1-phosphate cytidylyltransferase
MKVVLFCGGFGTRMQEYSETIPKPMVTIGYRPILWNLMKYYAYYGHKDFILCLGYKNYLIKKYFLDYDECLSNNFILTQGGNEVKLFNSDISDWTITFVDTGLHSNIGQRLNLIKGYLDGDDMFMANYADGLTDMDLNTYVDYFCSMNKVASFLCVQPSQSFHVVKIGENGLAKDIAHVKSADIWINGGFFIFKKDIFNYIHDGEELVYKPFERLIKNNELIAYKYPGFFASMDTFKEKQMFDDLYDRGERRWEVWNG